MSSNPLAVTTPESLQEAYAQLLRREQLWNANIQQSLRLIVNHCADALKVDRASIWHFAEQNQKLYCQALCDSRATSDESTMALRTEDHPAYFAAVLNKRVITAEDAQNNPITASFRDGYLRPLDIHSILDAGMRQSGSTVGVLCFEQTGGNRTWSQAEQNFAASVADLLIQLMANHALQKSEERYRHVFDSTTDAVFLMHNNLTIDCNESALQLFRCSFEHFTHMPPKHFWADRQADGRLSGQAAKHHLREALSGVNHPFEWRHRRADGTEFDAEVTLTRITLEHQDHIVACVRDITESKQRTAEIKHLLSLQNAIFDGASYSIISTDTLGKVLSFNRAAERLLGYHARDVIGKMSLLDFHDPDEVGWRAIELSDELEHTIDANFEVFTSLPSRGQREEREWSYIRQDGQRRPVLMSMTTMRENGESISGYVCIASDITERKKANEQIINSKREMEHRANHDELTGLPNRARLHDMAHAAIVSAQAKAQRLALMLIDLDRFKEVNDTLGHAIGDKLLQQIAVHLDNHLRSRGAQLYRLGGDEFAVLIPNVLGEKDAITIANGIHRQLRHPAKVDGITLELGGSIGVSLFPLHGDNSHSLLRCADVAMYKAKSESSRTVIYQAEQDAHSPRRLSMMGELGTAIRENQLVLYYQPRIDIANQTCLGCEALLRWQHPRLGMVPPGDFIPLAEMSDLIQPLGLWVLENAIIQAKKWFEQGLHLVVSVNLSTRNLMDAVFPQQIELLLTKYALPPTLLEIEITESTLIGDPERALEVINRIHRLGVTFAIDDFGTGYSSLSYLKRLPIHTLKIDRSFISDMLTDEQDMVIVKSTLGLAHSFALEVVAEGVEDFLTLEMLKSLSCEQAQGFYISRPVPAAEFDLWLQQQNPLPPASPH